MAEKSKITFVVPKSFQQDLREQVIKDGYGLRGKSKWVSEAVLSLLEVKNFPELVSYSDELCGFQKAETVVIDYELKQKLQDAVKQVRHKHPLLEGVKSRVLRTAILQRLLRG